MEKILHILRFRPKKGLRGYFYALSMLITLVALQITLKSRILLWVIRKLFFPVPGQGPSREKESLDILTLISLVPLIIPKNEHKSYW